MTALLRPGGLVDALLSYGIRFHKAFSDSNEITICCPFCGETRFRLGVNIYSLKGHCFNCDWRSRDAVNDILAALNLGITVVGGGAQAPGEADEPPGAKGEPALPEDFEQLNAKKPSKDMWVRRAATYLLSRGVTPEQVERKKIGVSLSGRYAYRIVFPVYYGSKLQGIVTRDFTGQQEVKYLNSPGMKAVYNSTSKKKKKAVLCEGIFDCLALERVLPVENCDVLSLLGHDLTEEQESRLEGYQTVVLWPDADLVGVKGFCRVARKLLQFHDVFVVQPGTEKDAGDSDPHDLKFMWTTRIRFNDAVEMRLLGEAVFRE